MYSLNVWYLSLASDSLCVLGRRLNRSSLMESRPSAGGYHKKTKTARSHTGAIPTKGIHNFKF